MKNDNSFIKELYDMLIVTNDKDLIGKNLEDNVRNLCYEKYVIKPENISRKYYAKIEKRLFDLGYGIIHLNDTAIKYANINKELRDEYTFMVIREQKDGIDTWLNYLSSNKSNHIPTWAKLTVFNEILDIDNSDNGEIKNRINTPAPFVRFDEEVLNKCIDIIKEKYGELTDTGIKKEMFRHIFKYLYVRELHLKDKRLKDITDGIWIDYHCETIDVVSNKMLEGKITEYERLHNSIKGYNTGWRISKIVDYDSFKRNIPQPCKISYHVYYTKDDNGEYKIPRMYIRTGEYGSPEEATGINEAFIEDKLEEKLNERLNEIGVRRWAVVANKLMTAGLLRTVQQMKRLDELYKNRKDRELTKEDLTFLYEINESIVSFVDTRDPRIAKLKKGRNKREDLAIVFDCKPEEIGLEKDDLYNNQLVFYDNFIIYNNMYNEMRANGFHLPKIVRYGVILPHVKDPEGLILPEYVGGTLALPSIERGYGLVLPKKCSFIDLSGLKTGFGVTFPDSVYCMDLNNLETLIGVNFPKSCSTITYHGVDYTLEEAKELQQEELKTYDPFNKKDKVITYGIKTTWYYKNG